METARHTILALASDTVDFALGALPLLGAALGILAVFLAPLWWMARSLGAF